MLRIAIIVGSTRENRMGRQVADWVLDKAQQHGGAEFELVDLLDQDLPVFNAPVPAGVKIMDHPAVQEWSKLVAGFDGFIVVAPEYNHGINAPLKNAIDHLYGEWANKVVGFVAYGMAGGVRAVEQLRLVFANLYVATVRTQVALMLPVDFTDGTFTPQDYHSQSLTDTIDQVLAWSGALKSLR